MTKHARPEIFVPMVKTLADQTCREAVKHFISLTGSAGRGGDFAPTYSFCHDISKIETGAGE